MRGKAIVPRSLDHARGITPAYAGKRPHTSVRSGCPRDHPRVCGEKSIVRPNSAPGTGSPPRMRGKASGVRSFRWAVGITPAYAGKRISGSRTHRHSRDHPRVCGEKTELGRKNEQYQGSPPRMRGKARRAGVLDVVGGITPAYAGKSQWWPPAGGRERDHPRVCGEKGRMLKKGLVNFGSPPRMRGKELSFVGFQPHTGITPAYAGKSMKI